MTIRELDRLITKTDLDPVAKMALRTVRRAVVSGRSGDPSVGETTWSVSIDSMTGTPMRMSFKIKRPTSEH
jgi:hypothetical protein